MSATTAPSDTSAAAPAAADSTTTKAARKPGQQRTCVCIVSGAVKMVRPEVLAKRIANAGGADLLAASYVCTESKQLLRDGKSVDTIRAEFKAAHPEAVIPTGTVSQSVIDAIMKKAAKPEAPATPAAADTVVITTAADGQVAKAAKSGSKKSGKKGQHTAPVSDATPAAAPATAETVAAS